jgi:hypothetical protein
VSIVFELSTSSPMMTHPAVRMVRSDKQAMVLIFLKGYFWKGCRWMRIRVKRWSIKISLFVPSVVPEGMFRRKSVTSPNPQQFPRTVKDNEQLKKSVITMPLFLTYIYIQYKAWYMMPSSPCLRTSFQQQKPAKELLLDNTYGSFF